MPAILTESDRRRLGELFDARRTGRQPDRYLLSGLVFNATDGHRMVGRQGRYVDWRPTERPRARLSVRSHLLHNFVLRAVREHSEAAPFEPTAAWDPSDELVRERERIVAEQRDLGRSELPLAVIEGRAERLQAELDAVDEQLDKAKPARPSTFWESYTPDAVFVRQHVRRVLVAPAARPGARFDPARVTIEWR